MNKFIKETDDHTRLGAWLKRNISHMKDHEFAYVFDTNMHQTQMFVKLRKQYAELRGGKWEHHEYIEHISYSAGLGWKLYSVRAARISWKEYREVLICIEDDTHATLFALDAWHDIANAAL